VPQVIWPPPMHQRGLKTRLESPEFKAVVAGASNGHHRAIL